LPRESVAAPRAQTAVGTAAATTDDSYWTQERATGDWDGGRNTLRNKGVELDFRLTQSYQGVSTDAPQNKGGYGGKFDTKFSFDVNKLARWQGLSGQVITETRFGDIPTVTGTKLIPTTYLITPKSAGTVFAITAVNVTQLVPINRTSGDFLVIGAGKYMDFDGADSPFHGGGGHTTFLHLAFNGTPTHGRLVPSVTNGANLAWVRKGNPFLTFSVRDATGHPTTPGITDMFEDGATFISGISVPVMMFTDSYGEQSCTAGRSSFITGQSVYRTGLSKVGIPGAKAGLQAETVTIAELLKNHGYATGQFGKNHLGDRNEFLPTVHGFDEFLGNLYHLNAEEEPEMEGYPTEEEYPGFRGVVRAARGAALVGDRQG
jgi:hypothetical protein